jgi:hypothetical protein
MYDDSNGVSGINIFGVIDVSGGDKAFHRMGNFFPIAGIL